MMDQTARTIDIRVAKANLPRLVERAVAGEEIVIAKDGKPLARLVPLPSAKRPVVYGAWHGKVHMSEDFNEPLPADIRRAFEGNDGCA